MGKISIEKNLFCLPWTQTILGTHLEGRVNFMALDWLTRVNYKPPMLGRERRRKKAIKAFLLKSRMSLLKPYPSNP